MISLVNTDWILCIDQSKHVLDVFLTSKFYGTRRYNLRYTLWCSGSFFFARASKWIYLVMVRLWDFRQIFLWKFQKVKFCNMTPWVKSLKVININIIRKIIPLQILGNNIFVISWLFPFLENKKSKYRNYFITQTLLE